MTMARPASPPTPADRPSNSRLFTTLAQAAALLLAVGLAGGATSASAQTSSAGHRAPSDQWQENSDEQMARQLNQEPSLRGSLIRVVIDQAAKKEDLRLSETADALLDVIEEDPGEQRRVLAIQALSVIGTDHLGEEQYGQVMSRLYALSKEDPSAEVRAAAGDLITRYQAG